MAKRPDLPLETEARNAYYQDPGRRAWALVAFMVEHAEYTVGPDGTKHKRQSKMKGRMVFLAAELNNQVLRVSAGYGGYHHAGAAGISRTNVIRAMAAEAERNGWITRERDRYGGVYNYCAHRAWTKRLSRVHRAAARYVYKRILGSQDTPSVTRSLRSRRVRETKRPGVRRTHTE